jgi:hypothetical protein
MLRLSFSQLYPLLLWVTPFTKWIFQSNKAEFSQPSISVKILYIKNNSREVIFSSIIRDANIRAVPSLFIKISIERVLFLYFSKNFSSKI